VTTYRACLNCDGRGYETGLYVATWQCGYCHGWGKEADVCRLSPAACLTLAEHEAHEAWKERVLPFDADSEPF
jgi:RecJ-like exonuclease